MAEIGDRVQDRDSEKGNIKIIRLKSPEARKRRSNLVSQDIRMQMWRGYTHKRQRCYQPISEEDKAVEYYSLTITNPQSIVKKRKE